jgi:two-component system OmpR family sensor kinase
VLVLAARGVARRLAWPLEDVADAAERFGRGDLAARTRVGGRRRWVAEEVSEVAQAFDQMAERISRVVRDQRELLAAISHELRSPLGRARVALEIVRDRAEGSAATGPIDDIDRQLADVDAILGDLLAAARAGLSDVKPVATPIPGWLRARLAAEPTPPLLELTCDVPDDVTALIDAPLLNRALHNLLANARAHGHPEDRPIEVTLDADATHVRILARDRGPGFAPELLARAFEPFVKGDAARTPSEGGGGYGLGLALVRRIAEAHGGKAFARNVEGGGAEVGVELPRNHGPSKRTKID